MRKVRDFLEYNYKLIMIFVVSFEVFVFVIMAFLLNQVMLIECIGVKK